MSEPVGVPAPGATGAIFTVQANRPLDGGASTVTTSSVAALPTLAVIDPSLAAWPLSPPYDAVMVWLPTDSDAVGRAARPVVSRSTASSVVDPSLNVTVPVGVPPPPGLATLAVNVTICPCTDTGASATIVVVVAAGAAATAADGISSAPPNRPATMPRNPRTTARVPNRPVMR